jgi:23S rRNA (cytosine1962-C5)-methyltransferase
MNAARSLRLGFSWVYRTELVEPPAVQSAGVVDVVDAQNVAIGQAFWANASPIALRLVTRHLGDAVQVNDSFWAERFEAALRRRRSLLARDAFRVIHGEADGVPGLFVDRYAEVLIIQTLSEAADALKAQWAKTLARVTGCTSVVCRDDASGRDFEKLPREAKTLFGTAPGKVKFHEGKVTLQIDVLKDSKTGSFLDQVDNHLRAGQLAHGKALDTFSYHGGFALSLASSCDSVIAVEQDETAANRIETHVAENSVDNVTVEHANAFDRLRRFESQGEHFDTVVIDPPGLAKRKEGLETAKRAYHELNLRAMKLVSPGGLLVSCSCSGRVSKAMFEEMLVEAARDAKREFQILERRGAGIDHPVIPGLPESEYLKAFFLRML